MPTYRAYTIPDMSAPADLPKALRDFADTVDNRLIVNGVGNNPVTVTKNDIDSIIHINTTSVVNVVCPADTSIPVGSEFCVYVERGFAKVVGASGVTVEKAGQQEIPATSIVKVMKVSNTVWMLERKSSYTTIDGVPAPPTIAINGRTLTWNDTTGSGGAATAWEVDIQGGAHDAIANPLSVKTAQVTGTVTNTNYTMRVRARNATGWSEWSNTITQQFNVPATMPTLNHIGAGSVRVTGLDLTQYSIQASVSNGTGSASVSGDTITGVGSTTQTITVRAYSGQLNFWTATYERKPVVQESYSWTTQRQENYQCNPHNCNPHQVQVGTQQHCGDKPNPAAGCACPGGWTNTGGGACESAPMGNVCVSCRGQCCTTVPVYETRYDTCYDTCQRTVTDTHNGVRDRDDSAGGFTKSNGEWWKIT